jgi:exopolyphosphatase/guanosine-5'-triphosphate,3'-diphosphate pyrophosphatase
VRGESAADGFVSQSASSGRVLSEFTPGGPARGAAGGPVRVAAIDCGTNSLRLLVADADPRERRLDDLVRRMEIVRLGQGVDATGRLAPDALARAFRVLEEYAAVITDHAVGAVRMVATSATRDAVNSAEFVRGVSRILGVQPEVLTGDQEAFLAFTGATAELAGGRPGGALFAPPYLVVDIGGGSTEFVLGGDHAGSAEPDRAGPVRGGHDRAGQVGAGQVRGEREHAGQLRGEQEHARHLRGEQEHAGRSSGERGGADRDSVESASPIVAISVDIGCVRMTERHLHSDPPTEAEIGAAVADIDTAIGLAAAKVPAHRARTLVGLAGSVTTVAGIALELPAYDASRIHHARIPAAQVHAVTRLLLGQARAQRAMIGVMHPGRIDVIGAGALVLDRIMARLGFAEVVVSEHDILDGIAWSMADRHAG